MDDSPRPMRRLKKRNQAEKPTIKTKPKPRLIRLAARIPLYQRIKMGLRAILIFGLCVIALVSVFLLHKNSEILTQRTANLLAKGGFVIDQIIIEGRIHTPPDRIADVIGVKQGDSIFKESPKAIKSKLEEVVWIRNALVQRHLPNVLMIRLVERQPIALWQHQGKHFLVDREGVVINEPGFLSSHDLPVLVGRDAPQQVPAMLKRLEKFSVLRKIVKGLTWRGNRRWQLHLEAGTIVHLPEVNVEEALMRLVNLIETRSISLRETKELDLRVRKKMVVVPHDKSLWRPDKKDKEI